MSENKFTSNHNTTLVAVSNADGETPVYLYADPATHSLTITGSPTITNDGTFAKETGGNLAQIVTNTGNNSTSANQTNGNQQTKITDGTNVANVRAGDTGLNGVVTAGSTKTITFSTSTPGAQTLLADTDVRGYASIEIVYTSVGSGLGITGGQFSTVGGGTYVNGTNWGNGPNALTSGLGTAVNVIYRSAIVGNFFQLAVSALTSGTFAGTVTLRATQTFPSTVNAGQNGTWTVGANSAIASAVPANAFFIGMGIGTGTSPTNLIGMRSAQVNDNASNGDLMLATSPYLFNGTGFDKPRNNTTGVVIAAGATTTQSAVALTTYNARSLTILANITAGAGTLTITIAGASSSSYTYTLLTSAALTGVADNALFVGPGLPATTNVSANIPLPRNVQITATVVGSVTYGVDYILSV